MAKIYIPDGKGNYIPFPVLKGDKGDKGDKGQDGADVEFAIIEEFLCYRYPEQEWVQIISIEQLTGPKGDKGETGTLFVPYIDEEGNLSWTNDGELENPETVNIKGPKGDTGEKGETGEQGIQGENGANGYTPVKGTDYFTPEEIENITLSLQQSLKQYIDEEIAKLNPTPEENEDPENPTPEENENPENPTPEENENPENPTLEENEIPNTEEE